jgi:hypothetical protein
MNKQLVRAVMVVGLGVAALVTTPKRVSANIRNCSGCPGDVCGTEGAALFCQTSCGGIGEGAYCEHNACGPGVDFVDCGEES